MALASKFGRYEDSANYMILYLMESNNCIEKQDLVYIRDNMKNLVSSERIALQKVIEIDSTQSGNSLLMPYINKLIEDILSKSSQIQKTLNFILHERCFNHYTIFNVLTFLGDSHRYIAVSINNK